MELLHGGGHLGDLAEVLEELLAAGALAKGPDVGEDVAGHAAAAVRDADDDELGGLANGDLDGGHGGGVGAGLGSRALADLALDDGLHRVAEELADNVLEVAEDVGEAGGEVALDVDLGDLDLGPVGGAGEGLDGAAAAVDDVLGDALDEDFADEVGFGELGAGGEPGGVVCFGEGEVLLGDDAT